MISHGLELECGRVTEAVIRDWALVGGRGLADAAVRDVVQREQFFELGFKVGHLIGGHVLF